MAKDKHAYDPAVKAEELAKHRAHYAWQEMVVACADLSPTHKVVLWRLALYRNIKTGRCDPSRIGLATGAGVTESTVKRAIIRAEQLGLLSVDRVCGRGNRNAFHFILSDEKGAMVTPFNAKEKGSRQSRKEVTAVTPEHVEHVERDGRRGSRRSGAPAAAPAEAVRQAKKSPAVENLPVPTDGEFATLRAAWPRPWLDDEAADRAAFAKVQSYATAEKIIASAQRWAAAVEPRYLPSLAKWLGGRCWEKPPPKKPKGNGKVDLVRLGAQMLLDYEEDGDGNLRAPGETLQ
jgi:hypothetical protein